MHLRPSSQPAFVRSVAALFAALAFACSGGPAQSPTQTTPPPDTDGGTVTGGDQGTQPPGNDGGSVTPPVRTTTLSLASGAVVAAAVPVTAIVPDGTSTVEFRVDGAIVSRDGQLMWADRAAVAAEARVASRDLMARAGLT